MHATYALRFFIAGQQMEEKGIEWVCPNCAKKKEDEVKIKTNAQNASGKHRILSDATSDNSKILTTLNQVSFGGETSSLIQHSDCDYGSVQYSSGMQCVVCKKEARNSSIYCSDACILAHAQETLTKDKPIVGSTISPKGGKVSQFDSATKFKIDSRVIVFERKTGRVLTGKYNNKSRISCIHLFRSPIDILIFSSSFLFVHLLHYVSVPFCSRP